MCLLLQATKCIKLVMHSISSPSLRRDVRLPDANNITSNTFTGYISPGLVVIRGLHRLRPVVKTMSESSPR